MQFCCVLIATAYLAPSNNNFPNQDFSKLLNFNLPLFLAGDFNAHHQIFDNCSRLADAKGKQLHNLLTKRKLNLLDPNFNTYISNRAKVKPDLVFSNFQAIRWGRATY